MTPLSGSEEMAQALDWQRFQTARLRLVPFQGTDAERAFCLNGFNDYEVVKQLARIPFPYGDKDFDAFCAAMAKARTETGEMATPEDRRPLVWSIVQPDDDQIIGQISLTPLDTSGAYELAYLCLRQVWGQGLVTEAVTAISEFAFDVLGAMKLWASIYVDNPASLRVAEKTGFEVCGHGASTSAARNDGIKYPHTEFELTADGFRAHRMREGCHSYTSIISRELPIVTVAAAALVNLQGQVLVAQRPQGKAMAGLWEFPGGKLEPGETPEAALIRELHEELGIDTDHSCLSPIAFASHSYAKFHLLMPLFAIRQWRGDLTGREGQALQWVEPKALWQLPMPAADEPLIPLLIDLL